MSEMVTSGGGPDDIDPNDDQFVAEEFDDDNVQGDDRDPGAEPDLDMAGYGPDHGLAVEEARVILDNGDVPQDSVDERTWREEPDRLEPDASGFHQELIEPSPDFGLDPDFVAESAAEFAHDMPIGAAVAEVAGPVEGLLPAEEAAMHVVADDDRDDLR